MAELYRLASPLLGSVVDYLPWELSLLLKHFFSCPLVLGRGQDVDGGRNDRFWTVRRVVHALSLIVCYLKRGLVVSYLQLVEEIFQHLQLYLCCCCTLCVANNRFYNRRFVHCGFCGIECCPISFLAYGRTSSFL